MNTLLWRVICIKTKVTEEGASIKNKKERKKETTENVKLLRLFSMRFVKGGVFFASIKIIN